MLHFKSFLRGRLAPPVWQALSDAKIEYRLSKVTTHISQDLRVELDRLIKNLPQEFEKDYFDIGAHDGRSVSNTFHLDHELGWSGVLVEPILHLHFASKKFRSQHRNTFVNAACVGPEYRQPAIKLLYCNLMTIAPEISENNAEEWVRGGEEFLHAGEQVTDVWAPARTANSILIENEAPSRIGLLSIDVEGAEYEVLMGIDFNIFSFGIILMETADESPANNILVRAGYKFHKQIGQNKLFLNHFFLREKV